MKRKYLEALFALQGAHKYPRTSLTTDKWAFFLDHRAEGNGILFVTFVPLKPFVHLNSTTGEIKPSQTNLQHFLRGLPETFKLFQHSGRMTVSSSVGCNYDDVPSMLQKVITFRQEQGYDEV